MVFEWVTAKFKQRQLQKAQIQAEADHMVIVSGLSILNPTARTFFKDMPFYDAETDSVDFKKLEQYICDLRYLRYSYNNKHCKTCFYKKNSDDFNNACCELSKELTKHKHTPYTLAYGEQTELENLRGLFKILTGEDVYKYPTDMHNVIEIVKEFKEQLENNNSRISNFENKIYQKNKEIERLQTLLDENPVKEVVKVIEKEPAKDSRPITRSSKIYNKFKLHDLKRDEVCQCCGATHNLHVHHLSSYKHDKARRADTSNGIVLCEECHQQFHSLYGKGHKNNPVNFAKFMREYAKPMQVNLDYEISSENIFEEILGGK